MNEVLFILDGLNRPFVSKVLFGHQLCRVAGINSCLDCPLFVCFDLFGSGVKMLSSVRVFVYFFFCFKRRSVILSKQLSYLLSNCLIHISHEHVCIQVAIRHVMMVFLYLCLDPSW